MKAVKITKQFLMITVLLGLLGTVNVFAQTPEPDKDLVFFKIGVSQGTLIYDPSYADALEMDFTNNLLTQIGYKTELDQTHSLLFLYGLNYQGPGVRGYSEEGFSARSMDHLLLAKYISRLSSATEIAYKTDFFYQFYRIGKSETWGEGLYNFGKTGLGVDLVHGTSPSHTFLTGLELHYFWFPNYNDLMREALYMLSSSTGANLSEDVMNQDFLQLSFRLGSDWRIDKDTVFKVDNTFLYRNYLGLRIDTEDYSTSPENNDKQYDLLNDFSLEFGYFLSDEWLMQIKYNFALFLSNYNYLVIKNPFPLDYDFNKNYSSNHAHSLSLPFTYIASSRSSWTFAPQIEFKHYFDRQARDKSGAFTGDTQYNLAYSAMVSWEYKKHENFTIAPHYIFKVAQSNNKDQTTGYNFLVQYLGVQFIFEY